MRSKKYFTIFIKKSILLKNRFTNLLENYTEDSKLIAILWDSVFKKYSEKHRAYHNLTHLEEIFKYFDVYQQEIEEPNTMAFSIFYHDVIYNIWKKDNEEKSADFAIDKLQQISLPTDILHKVHQQIIATKRHESSNTDTKYLLDFDLAILGQPEHIYKTYTQKIRKEYKLIPSLIYKKGRIKVLEHFSNKSSIYKTSAFIDFYEQQAKENLQTELNTLKNGS